MTHADELPEIAEAVRRRILELSHAAGTPHLGSALSCVDVLVAAYFGGLNIGPDRLDAPDRDRLIFSKGHAALALYVTLARRGILDPLTLERYARAGSALGEQPIPGVVPGVEAATGALGHGLPLALGHALAARIRGLPYRTLVILGDGECNEGTTWEAAMLAAARRLGNLILVVDFNRWQATGRSDEIMAIEPLAEKFRAFGWSEYDVDGHDPAALRAHILGADPAADHPVALIAHTVKGKGVSFMEDDNNWHYRVPDEAELAAALREFDAA